MTQSAIIAGGNALSKTAMILAAGRGSRMRALTKNCPKPLLPLDTQKHPQKHLIDWPLSRLKRAGIERILVNAHYLAEQMVAYIESLPGGGIGIEVICEEALLETGGGVLNVLERFENRPFFALNGDSIWQEEPSGALLLDSLREGFDIEKMQALLAVHRDTSGRGDFLLKETPMGRVERRGDFHFMGVQILTPSLFEGLAKGEVFSLNLLYDRAMAAKTLFGLQHKARWWHLGTPESLEEGRREIDLRRW